MADSTPHTLSGVALLETKLYAPRWRSELVTRPRLIDRLNRGSERSLTLISAPAGFGKTTLLAEWLSGHGDRRQHIGWFSLGASDNDPTIFWAYFIRALQRVRTGMGDQALGMLFTPQPPPIQSVLTTLINEISLIEDHFTLILDDYHLITEGPIHDGMAFLIDHKPPLMHLIIVSRADPPFPLARLRANRELTEIRAADLRFTPEEASNFLNGVMSLNLSSEEIGALEHRTEGWITGLQLAALSMQGHGDTDSFIASYSGDDRFVVDYLVEEVLRRQPDTIRHFLLQTSILDRLSGPLCDAVTDSRDGHNLLEQLERSNLFVVPLDDKRHWFRYHHLFGDVLQSHMAMERPDSVNDLHHRASLWFEQNNLHADAIHHAMKSGNVERAADLIAVIWPLMNRTYQSATVIGWMRLLPEALIRSRPILSVGFAWGLLEEGNMEGGKEWLEITEDILQAAQSDENPELILDDKQVRYITYHLASARTYYSLAFGDIPSTIRFAQKAQEVYPEGDYLERSIPVALMGIAYWSMGDLKGAYDSFSRVMNLYHGANDVMLAISCAFVVAEIFLDQGKLKEALASYLNGIELIEAQDTPLMIGTTDLHVGAGMVYLLMGKWKKADHHLARSVELGDPASLPGNSYRRYAALAQFKEFQGMLDDALRLFSKAEDEYVLSPIPITRPFAAQKVRSWIKQGRLENAVDWVTETDISASDPLSYLNEFNHLTLARIGVALFREHGDEPTILEALDLLQRLLEAAEEGQRNGSVIQILILQALALHAQNDVSSALATLERALGIAAPEHYVYVFTAEGEPMLDLLRHAARGGIGGAYTRSLLAEFNEPLDPTPSSNTLPSPLTSREMEVLRLIAAGMRNKEIADHLFISLSTVKRHIANTYSKLEVTHRTEAIVKGEELGIL